MNLTINNWQTFLKRKDIKKPTWFAFKNYFFDKPEVYDMPHDQIVLMTYLMCLASKTANCGSFTFHFKMCENTLRININRIDVLITELMRIGWVTRASRPRNVRVSLEESRVEESRVDAEANGVEETSSPPSPLETEINKILLRKIKQSVISAWVVTYKDTEFIKHELNKASTWLLNNPDRAPKSRYGQFMSRWLDRGWENHRKGLNGNGTSKKHEPTIAVYDE